MKSECLGSPSRKEQLWTDGSGGHTTKCVTWHRLRKHLQRFLCFLHSVTWDPTGFQHFFFKWNITPTQREIIFNLTCEDFYRGVSKNQWQAYSLKFNTRPKKIRKIMKTSHLYQLTAQPFLRGTDKSPTLILTCSFPDIQYLSYLSFLKCFSLSILIFHGLKTMSLTTWGHILGTHIFQLGSNALSFCQRISLCIVCSVRALPTKRRHAREGGADQLN